MKLSVRSATHINIRFITPGIVFWPKRFNYKENIWNENYYAVTSILKLKNSKLISMDQSNEVPLDGTRT